MHMGLAGVREEEPGEPGLRAEASTWHQPAAPGSPRARSALVGLPGSLCHGFLRRGYLSRMAAAPLCR